MTRALPPAALLTATQTWQMQAVRMTTTTGGIGGIWSGVRARVLS